MRRRRRPSRAAIGLVLLLLVALLFMLWAGRGKRTGYLDPGAVDPAGSRAVAQVLGNNGVTVQDERLTANVLTRAPGATVLVVGGEVLTREVVSDLLAAAPARIVVIGGYLGTPLTDRLAAGVEYAQDYGDDVVDPRCDFATATRAGAADLPGTRYDARDWVAPAEESGSDPTEVGMACYDRPESAALVILPERPGRSEVVLLGSDLPLRNDGFNEEGNAALALGLLGAHEELIWWRPTFSDPAIAASSDSQPLMELVPSWVLPVVVQLFLVSLLLAWWRARRMGPLSLEPLPVVIRAGETTSGRARLLAAHHARGEAADDLRAAAREQLRSKLDLPHGVAREALVAAVAGRTNRVSAQVDQMLFGGEPATDSQLVALAADCRALVQEVRNT